MISALDHIALVVRDLNAAAAQYEKLLARAPNWRGADGGAEHVWFQLENMALDLITPIGAGPTGEAAAARLESHGEGLWAIAFTAPDMARARRVLARRNVPSTEPRRHRSTHVETGAKRYWNTSILAPDSAQGPLTFLIAAPSEPWPVSPMHGQAPVVALDHVVIRSPNPDRAAAFYGARLGLNLRLDRSNPDWSARLMFFRCDDLIVEIAHDLKAGVSDAPDALWGLSWRVADADVARARLAAAGLNVSEVRAGRKPGTRIVTVRDNTCAVPTILVEPANAGIEGGTP